jgi:hypothetical protein
VKKYSSKTEEGRNVVVTFQAYVKDFKELLSAERLFKSQLDQRYKISGNSSQIGIETRRVEEE